MMSAPENSPARLSPLDECLARIALANTIPEDRLSLGLSAVVGAPDGQAVVLRPDEDPEPTESPAPAP